MEPDWLRALCGGLLIGGASVLLLFTNGRIFGVSGILGGVLAPKRDETLWRVAVVLGLISGGVLLDAFYPEAFDAEASRTMGLSILAGLLVGYGTRLGNGCTSGHGICGISRLSIRSIAATVTFGTTGMVTASLMGWLGGAP